MNINFFNEHCQITTDQSKFGLCDEQSNKPAYIDSNISNEETWIAIVENANQIKVTFTSIDNCIEIESKQGKRCDGMLTYENCIIFVELEEFKEKTGFTLKIQNNIVV